MEGTSCRSCNEGKCNANAYENGGEDESCSCQQYYQQEEPFLWGDDEDPSKEGVFDATWPGKREDSFYDSLTR
jgi:hypothetical protein